MEHGKSEVRIMTTHASKGLEAPVVFLVDPGSAPFSHAHGARLIAWPDMPGLFPDRRRASSGAPTSRWRTAMSWRWRKRKSGWPARNTGASSMSA